jgi:uncharacterized membrane protein YgcG
LTRTNTGLLQGTVPQIFEELYRTFGAITPQSLNVAKDKLQATTYNHSRPIVNLFTAITKYANMADAANSSKTPTQLINIGLIIITRSTIYANDIRIWHDKPLLERTWLTFKEHFKTAQRAIKRSQPIVTTDSLGYHEQANAASLVDQVIDRLTTQQEADTAITSANSAELLAEQQMQQHLANMANSSQQNQTMLKQMQPLTSTLSTLQSQANNQNRSTGGGNEGRGRGGKGRGGRGSGGGHSGGRGGRGRGRGRGRGGGG